MSSNDRPEDDVLTEKNGDPTESREPAAAPKPGLESEEGLPDFDVNPSGTLPDQDFSYRPRKSSGGMSIILGIAAVVGIIALTWYAFRSEPGPAEPEAAAPPPVEEAVPEPDEPVPPLTLPEKVADAADFSPTPETIAAATAPPSTLPAATSAAKPAEAKPAEAKSAEAKPAEGKPAAKPAEAKPAAKPAEAKPAAKPAEAKPAAKPAETKPAEAKPAEAKPAEAKPSEAKPVEAKPAETKPAEAQAADKPAEAAAALEAPADAAPAAESKPAEAPVAPISNYWVVNISSTPDAAESLRLLTRMLSAETGGQVYAYEATVDGRPHHRIRVGFFETRAEAEAVGLRLKDEYKLSSTPWAVKPTVEEVERYRKK